MNDFVVMMLALIEEAKKLGGTPESVAAQIQFNWNAKEAPKPHPQLDAWGRYKLSNGRLIISPVPLIENWAGLTEQQVENIRTNCCVDALGRWKWTDDEGEHVRPAAFSGFYTSESPPRELVVAGMFQAERYDQEVQPDGTDRMVYKGLFAERTYKTRFTSLAAAEAYAWPV